MRAPPQCPCAPSYQRRIGTTSVRDAAQKSELRASPLQAGACPMKHALLFTPVLALLAACAAPDTKTADAAAPPVVYKAYGDSITAEGALAMADFAKAAAGKDSLDAKITAEIITSCTKKGCWMDVKMADGTPMKVRFKDYAFFVPTSGLEGKQAVLQGHATKEVTDVAMLRHYAEDAGRSPEEIAKITAPETSWSFVADGVLIKD